MTTKTAGSARNAGATVIQPKERPIIMTAESVRAILDGTKTQTRRVATSPKGSGVDIQDAEWVRKFSNGNGFTGCWSFMREISKQHSRYGERLACNSIAIDTIRCPYGKVGDRLWVREAMRPLVRDAAGVHVTYRADNRTECVGDVDLPHDYKFDVRRNHNKHWRPSIHMPRWASRITLEVTDVRVERVQAISEADVWAEGENQEEYEVWLEDVHCIAPPGSSFQSPKGLYENTWNEINYKRKDGIYAWDRNPFVWAVTFKKI